MFFVKLQGCNLYTNDFVFVPQFTRCSVVLRDRRTRSPNGRVDVGSASPMGKTKSDRGLRESPPKVLNSLA